MVMKVWDNILKLASDTSSIPSRLPLYQALPDSEPQIL